MSLTLLSIAGACAWAIILLLPWRPWAASEVLDVSKDVAGDDLSDITILIPARNEASVIGTTLAGLKTQGEEIYSEALARLENHELPNKEHARFKQGGQFEVIVS